MNKKNMKPRGLESLLKTTNNFKKVDELSAKTRESGRRANLDLNSLIPNPFQPRQVFDEQNLLELSDSIKQHGLIQPITVRRSKNDPSKYEIIAGERRFRATKLAGLKSIDAIVQSWDDKTTRTMTLLENIQREDLNHIEVAKSYKGLQDELNLTQNQVAEIFSKNRATVGNFLRLLDLPTKTKKLVEDNVISGSFARTLLRLKDNDLIDKWASDLEVQSLSVNALEKKVKNEVNKDKSTSTKEKKSKLEKDSHLIELEKKVSSLLNTNVVIGPKTKKGKITISYSDEKQLVEILTKISKNEI